MHHIVKEPLGPILHMLYVMSNVAISPSVCSLDGMCCLFILLCTQKLVPTGASSASITRPFVTVTMHAYRIVGKNCDRKKNRNLPTRVEAEVLTTSVAPIIRSAIRYWPIIGVVMHIDISGAFLYQFFLRILNKLLTNAP